MRKQDCPTSRELTALLQGQIAEDQVGPLAVHLDSCDDCRALIDTIGDSGDTLASALARPAPQNEYAEESAFARAESLIRAVGREPSFAGAPGNEAADEDISQVLGTIGQYELAAKLGEGGMGTVYKALHTKLEKIVALKVLPADRMKDTNAVERFEREMRAVGKLDHPNIVRAMDAGEAAEMHYLVMEYVDGLDLSALVRRVGPLQAADACEIARQAAIGLQEAHEHNMVHRDIKPSNLMLANVGRGNQPPVVKVLDLGLALLDESKAERRELTSTGQMMGTLDYMAPEQGGDSHEVDIRADIYSLGATLYKLLCGEAPFSSERYNTPIKLLTALATADIPSIATKRDDLPGGLVSIVDRMLAKQPSDRFATPQELAAALAPFAHDADLSSLLDRGERKEDETPVDQSAVGTREHITSESKDTEPTLDRTLQSEPLAEQPVAESSTVEWENASPAGEEVGVGVGCGDSRTGAIDSEGQVRLAGSPHPTGSTQPSGVWNRTTKIVAAVAGMAALFAALTVVTIQTDKGTIKVVSHVPDIEVTIRRNSKVVDGFQVKQRDGATSYFSGDYEIKIKGGMPDGVSITNEEFKLTRGKDVLVEITRERQVASAEPVPAPQVAKWQPGPAEDVLPGIVPRPATLPGVKRWQIETRNLRARALSMDWHPDGKLIACATSVGNVRLYDPATLELVRILPGHSHAKWNPSGSLLATCDRDGEVHLEDSNGNLVSQFSTGASSCGIEWNKGGDRLACFRPGEVTIRRVPDGKVAATIARPGPPYINVAWSPDGNRLVVGSGSNVLIYSIDGELQATIKFSDTNVVQSVSWSPDGERLLAVGGRQAVIYTSDGDQIKELPLSGGHFVLAEWSPDGRSFAVSGYPFLDVFTADGTRIHEIKQNAVSFSWSPDSQRIVAAIDWYANFGIEMFDVDGASIRRAKGFEANVIWGRYASNAGDFFVGGQSLRWRLSANGAPLSVRDFNGSTTCSANGEFFVGRSENASVIVDTEGKELEQFQGQAVQLVDVAWSRDGTKVATASNQDKTARIWTRGEPQSILLRHDHPVNAVAWHPKGELLATAGQGAMLRFWTDKGQPTIELQGTQGSSTFYSLDWHPGGEWLASSDDELVRLWRPDGSPGPVFKGHQHRVTSVSWSPDGEWLASASSDATVRLWRTDGTAGPVFSSPDNWRSYNAFVTWSAGGRHVVSNGSSGVIAWDVQTQQPAWASVFLPDQQVATFSGAGQLLHSTGDEVQDQIVYIVENEDGSLELLKPSEFQKRIGQSLRLQPYNTPAQHRELAEWVLSKGGYVLIAKPEGGIVEIDDQDVLPDGELTVFGAGWANKHVSADDLRELANRVPPSFQQLQFRETMVTDEEMSIVSQILASSKLQADLFLVEEPRITGSGLRYLANLHMNWLILTSTSVTDEHLAVLPKLKFNSLQLEHTEITDECLVYLRDRPWMHQLSLDSTRVGDEGLRHLTGYRIDHLGLSDTVVSDAGLMHLSNSKGIGSLYIGKTNVTEAGVTALSKALPNCRIEWDGGVIEPTSDIHQQVAEWVLKVGGWLTATNGDNQSTEARKMDDLPDGKFKITQVILGGGDIEIDSAGLELLNQLESLEMLGIGENPNVSDATLAGISSLALGGLYAKDTILTDEGIKQLNLRDLGTLYVPNTAIGDEGFKYVSAAPKLHTINASNTSVTDEGISALADRPLRSLHLNDCSGITDDALQHLKDWPDVVSLQLANTQVTDAGLTQLTKIYGQLVLAGTLVSKEGIRKLHQANPNVAVLTDWNREPNRRTADWALACGGTVIAQFRFDTGYAYSRTLQKLDDIPDEEFRITGIALNSAQLDHGGQSNFGGLAGLRRLDLSGTRVAPRHVTDAFSTLNALSLNDNPVVNDASLASLAKHQNLSLLELRNTTIGKNGVEALKKLNNLRYLDLTGTKIPPTFIKSLQEALPNCLVVSRFNPASKDADRRAAHWLIAVGGGADIASFDENGKVSDDSEFRRLDRDREHFRGGQSEVFKEPFALVEAHMQSFPLFDSDWQQFEGNYLWEIYLDSAPVTAEAIKQIGRFPLGELVISNTVVDDDGLKSVAELENLVLLSLRNCPNITD
ncbi:MAG: protein kinase, partial [Pirellulaceae bacterium]|nr:protein kinase [Pirellulaceae bacterium]